MPFDQGGGGVTLRLRKVRVLDLVEYQGSTNDDLEWGEEFSQGANDKDDDVDGEDF